MAATAEFGGEKSGDAGLGHVDTGQARAHGEGTNGNQALFRVYDRMTNQTTA